MTFAPGSAVTRRRAVGLDISSRADCKVRIQSKDVVKLKGRPKLGKDQVQSGGVFQITIHGRLSRHLSNSWSESEPSGELPAVTSKLLLRVLPILRLQPFFVKKSLPRPATLLLSSLISPPQPPARTLLDIPQEEKSTLHHGQTDTTNSFLLGTIASGLPLRL